MLGITFFYRGQKAQYIDCLAKLIDLATELDFVERAYDLGFINKGNNEKYSLKKVLHGQNENNFESEEVSMKELKPNYNENIYKSGTFEKKNVNEIQTVQENKNKIGLNADIKETTEELQGVTFEKKKDFEQDNHGSQSEVEKKIVDFCDDNKVNVNKIQTIQENDNETGLNAEIKETTEELQGLTFEKKKDIKQDNHGRQSDFCDDSKVIVNEIQTGQEIEIEAGLNPEIKETTEEQGVKKNDKDCTPPIRKNVYASGSFHCKFCGKSYMEERTLRDHVKFRHKREGFICTICNHLSRNKRDLSAHVDGMHGTPKHLCTICGSKFSQKSGLGTHTKAVHDKLKYNCNECTHVSTTLSSLGWHMKQKHTGIAYSCENCAFKSKTTYGLERHQSKYCKSKNDNYHCRHCGHISKTYGGWYSHKAKKFCLSDKFKSQLERRTVCCPMCDSKFTQANNLNIHIKRMHKSKKGTGIISRNQNTE